MRIAIVVGLAFLAAACGKEDAGPQVEPAPIRHAGDPPKKVLDDRVLPPEPPEPEPPEPEASEPEASQPEAPQPEAPEPEAPESPPREADESPKVVKLTGEATHVPGSKSESKPLATGDTLKPGEDVSLADGAKMKVDLASGAYMEVTGPANFALRRVSDFSWTVALRSGTIDHFVAKDYFIGVSVLSDVFVALRKGDVTVSVNSSNGSDVITVTLNEGRSAKIVQGAGGEARNLVIGEPVVIRRSKAAK